MSTIDFLISHKIGSLWFKWCERRSGNIWFYSNLQMWIRMKSSQI